MLSVMLRNSSREIKMLALQRRNISSFFRSKSEKQYKIKDSVEPSYSIIYKAPMEMYLAACNQVTAASVFFVGAFAIYAYTRRFEPLSTEVTFIEGTSNLAGISEADTTYFAIGLVVICAMFRVILYKYPLRIYRDQTK